MSHVLSRWEPENTAFWSKEGSSIANRNLWISIPALMLAFSVWMLWSVVAANLDKAGFKFSKDQLFFLTALPALSGGIFHRQKSASARLEAFRLVSFWAIC